ncbi:MAG: lactate utilization protein [Clostridia bacterium]|nr:lactate utilization protein [Clostridia bacterium]MBR4979552.1 lactate utilization protein [Clostridia bacterium]
MDKNKFEVIRLKMERTANSLRRNNMFCECADNCEDALEIIRELLTEGDTICAGGSMTLEESGVMNMLKEGPYNFLDRNRPGITNEERRDIYTAAFSSDVFITSSNAITEKGELYNVDGNGNRVSAMIYGPKSVIVVAGYNKIVKDLKEAETRVKEIAAPANAIRLSCGTPCTESGKCMECMHENRICADTVIMSRQRVKERIKVILIGEALGY